MSESLVVEGMELEGINHPLSPHGSPVVVDTGTVNIAVSHRQIEIDFFDANGNDAGKITIQIKDGKLVASLSPRTRVGPPIECILEDEMHLEA